MGNTFQVSRGFTEIIETLKRVRPSEWIVSTPPPKRVRLGVFEDNGAKAVNIPDIGTVIHIK